MVCREALQQWQAHFGQRLMDIHVVQGNLQDAQRCLDQALQPAVQSDNISTQVPPSILPNAYCDLQAEFL